MFQILRRKRDEGYVSKDEGGPGPPHERIAERRRSASSRTEAANSG